MDHQIFPIYEQSLNGKVFISSLLFLSIFKKYQNGYLLYLQRRDEVISQKDLHIYS